MEVDFKVDGLDQVLEWAKSRPLKMLKVTSRATQVGAARVVRTMYPHIDERWRRLVHFKVTTGQYRNIYCKIGFFNRHEKSVSSDIDDWFKAYWANYGTLTRRDPNHKFQYSVKPAHYAAAKRRRNNVGQPHQNFYDRAIQGYDTVFFNAFAADLARSIKNM